VFKVIEFGTNRVPNSMTLNREPVYDFLLEINSNLGPISHRYWDAATYWPKTSNSTHPLSFTPSFRVTTFEFTEKLYGSWN